MKVKTSITGPTATVPRQVKAYGKEGSIEAVAVANGRHAMGLVVEGRPLLFPGGKETTVESGLARHAEVGVDEAGPPSPYKGSWRVAFGLIEGRPLLELRRKMTAYASVLVVWDGKAWTWEVSREERWFAKGKASDRGTADSMERAIHTAVASLDKHVRDACVVQHLQKRTAHDAGWAATHPERPERPAKEVPVLGKPAGVSRQRSGAKKKANNDLPTSPEIPSTRTRRRQADVVPARTAADREADERWGPLEVTPLFTSPEPAPPADTDTDAALMRMFAAAVDQALSSAS